MTLDVLFPKPIKRTQLGQPIQNIIQEGIKVAQVNHTQFNNISPIPKQQHTISNMNSLFSSTEILQLNNDIKDTGYSVDGYKDHELMWYDFYIFKHMISIFINNREFLCNLQPLKSPQKKAFNKSKFGSEKWAG